MSKKLLFVFTVVLFVGCRATYNERLDASKNVTYHGDSAERESLKAVFKTLKPEKNKKPELYHIYLQKSSINSYWLIMYWIIGDIRVKKIGLVDHSGEKNTFALSNATISPKNRYSISASSAYFIESNYAKSIDKVLLLDSKNNVLSELSFDTAEIIETSDSNEEHIFGETKADKLKDSVMVKIKAMKPHTDQP